MRKPKIETAPTPAIGNSSACAPSMIRWRQAMNWRVAPAPEAVPTGLESTTILNGRHDLAQGASGQ